MFDPDKEAPSAADIARFSADSCDEAPADTAADCPSCGMSVYYDLDRCPSCGSGLVAKSSLPPMWVSVGGLLAIVAMLVWVFG